MQQGNAIINLSVKSGEQYLIEGLNALILLRKNMRAQAQQIISKLHVTWKHGDARLVGINEVGNHSCQQSAL